jgi:hypothetical protein
MGTFFVAPNTNGKVTTDTCDLQQGPSAAPGSPLQAVRRPVAQVASCSPT